MPPYLMIGSAVVYFIVGIFIAVAVDPDAERITSLAVFFSFSSPFLGPILGWLLVWRPYSRAAEKRQKAEWEKLKGTVSNAVRRHRPALERNLRNALKSNNFGTVSAGRNLPKTAG